MKYWENGDKITCEYCLKDFDPEEYYFVHVKDCKNNNIKPTHYNKGKEDLIEIEIKIKIKDEKLKRHIELIEAFREVQKQEFYKAIEEILKKP